MTAWFHFAEAIRERTMALLTKAYTTISLADCAVVIGASEHQALQCSYRVLNSHLQLVEAKRIFPEHLFSQQLPTSF
eukprot:1178395-Prorocentrum_minimum.AAC.9